MGPTTPKLMAFAELLKLLVAMPGLTRPPATGNFSVNVVEGGRMAHWAFNIQTELWPAVYLLVLAIGLEVLRRIASALEIQTAAGDEGR